MVASRENLGHYAAINVYWLLSTVGLISAGMTFGVADRGEVTNGTANGTGTTGPGTGKSYHRHCIVQDDEKMGFTAACMAPTGKATFSLSTARTIHNYLGIIPMAKANVF